MELDQSFVMLDPATDQVLSLCSGPTVDGRCPRTDIPPYVCSGLHLVGTGESAENVSLTVTTQEPNHCPLA